MVRTDATCARPIEFVRQSVELWLRRREGDMAPGKVWIIAALLIGAAVAPQVFGQSNQAPSTIPLTDIPQLAALLADPNAAPAQRDEAAQRLVARHTPAAVDAV